MSREHNDTGAKPVAALWQMLLCVLLLGVALVFRYVLPEQTQRFLREHVAEGYAYATVFRDIGAELRAFVIGQNDGDGQRVDSHSSGDGAQTTEPGVLAEPATGTGPGQSDETKPPETLSPQLPVGEDSYDPAHEPPPDSTLGIGGFDAPVVYMYEEFLQRIPDGDRDDTPPVAFDVEVPASVDYSYTELPFDYADPTAGTVSSLFNYRVHPVYGHVAFHYGVDIANSQGTDITAFADGEVASVGVSSGYGNYIILNHSDGYVTVYAHCRRITVQAGQGVARGERIATMGMTGVATGPHLHFELRCGERWLNPSYYLTL